MAVNNIDTLKQGIGINITEGNNAEVDGIEILVNMAKQGKIDPWNIDIVDLYDKYMARISKLKQDNLRSVGKALLFSSTLLRIKSDIFQGISINDFEVEPLDYFEDDDFGDDYDDVDDEEDEEDFDDDEDEDEEY